MGIFRNYGFYEKKSKAVIVLYIMFKVMLCVLSLMNNISIPVVLLPIPKNMKAFYAWGYMNIFFGDIICIVCSIFKSREYKMAVLNLMTVHDAYSEDVHYKKYLKQTAVTFVATCGVILFVELSIGVWNYYLIQLYLNERGIILFMIFSVFCNKVNYYLNFIALQIYLDIISNLLKCLNGTLAEIIGTRGRDYTESILEINRHYKHSELSEKIQEWVKLRERLVLSGQQLTACLKYQVNIYA